VTSARASDSAAPRMAPASRFSPERGVLRRGHRERALSAGPGAQVVRSVVEGCGSGGGCAASLASATRCQLLQCVLRNNTRGVGVGNGARVSVAGCSLSHHTHGAWFAMPRAATAKLRLLVRLVPCPPLSPSSRHAARFVALRGAHALGAARRRRDRTTRCKAGGCGGISGGQVRPRAAAGRVCPSRRETVLTNRMRQAWSARRDTRMTKCRADRFCIRVLLGNEMGAREVAHDSMNAGQLSTAPSSHLLQLSPRNTERVGGARAAGVSSRLRLCQAVAAHGGAHAGPGAL
jgi:hypothetical protein